MTLVALLALTTGAWAESKPIGLNVEYAAGDEITSTTDVYVYYGEQPSTSKQMVVKITSTQPLKILMITGHSFDLYSDAEVYYMPSGESTGGYAGGIPCLGESTGDETVVHVASGTGTLDDPYVFGSGPSGTPVPLTRGTGEKINEWTLTNGMPAGNVTVNVKYFPQAEFAMSTDATPVALAPTAIADVPATTDGPIVKAGTVANIGSTEIAQGTVMYYVSTTPMTDAQLQALTPDKWSANVPTAESLAEGQAYVYYYIKGAEPATIAERTDANTCSDGDILAANVVNVTLAAAPLWNAEFDLTNAPEEDKAPGVWSTDIPKDGVVKGTEVTVTYTGTKKIIGVKAEKKKVAEGHALSASAVGEIVGSDGNVYAVADKDNLPDGVTAVAMVAYKSATAGSSLAIALADEGSMNWNSAKGTCASKAAIGGKSWKLPTKDEWDQMFSANGGSTGLKTALSAAGGASSTLQNGNYWSSTEVVLDPEDDPDMAWLYSFGDVRWYWDDMVHGNQVRACLAF